MSDRAPGQRPSIPLRPQLTVMGLPLERLSRFRGTGMIWGIGIGSFVTLLLSNVPIFKKDVLVKVPVVRNYFIDTTPDSDKPF